MTKSSAVQSFQIANQSNEAIDLTPNLGKLLPEFLDFCRSMISKGASLTRQDFLATIESFRNGIIPDGAVEQEYVAFLFAQSLVLDLLAQGWNLQAKGFTLTGQPPQDGLSGTETKETTRHSHLIGRDFQLNEKSVRKFVKGMERRRQTSKGWHSIFSLMRDGSDLAPKLREALLINDDQARYKQLAEVISPYLQFVETDARCDFTGLRLSDIWRYFRHTWVNEYKSVPGRSIMILVRDAAAPNHPVIGIAALGSSVVQSRLRDGWIGWLSDEFVRDAFDSGTFKTQAFKDWCDASIDRLLSQVYQTDLFDEGVIREEDLWHPSENIIKTLIKLSNDEIKKHRSEPQKSTHKIGPQDVPLNGHWEAATRTFLYRSKRCKQLATLLSIRKELQRVELTGREQLRKERQSDSRIKAAVGQLIRSIKAEHVGVNMMDITVCGAIAPYNPILGGKLVCMLLCSPEVVQEYRRRYKNKPSIIASSMSGMAVTRNPELVLLCTTSLYGNSNSQYNRVRIPLNEVGIDSNQSIVYKNLRFRELRKSTGFGTYQFSQLTIRLGSELTSRKTTNRIVNSIFGEGVNPLMRKMRESISSIGLDAERLLLHGNQRTTYGIALASNFREILSGKQRRPRYFLPQKGAHKLTESIGDYWRRRWLDPRLKKDGILSEIERHNLLYPIEHGALVPLPDLGRDVFS